MTVVLDDDPTGTQEVTGVPVLLRRDETAVLDLLSRHDAVYVLTNTRALSEEAAGQLVRQCRDDAEAAAAALGVRVLVVQRGDSTLRGHVFAEIDAVVRGDEVIVFVPAFPAGGRRTRSGVHEVMIDGSWINAADTEFARDPVFGYSERTMIDYVAARTTRPALSTTAAELGGVLGSVPAGTVVIPDVETDDDLVVIAAAIRDQTHQGLAVLVRTAAPLAGYLAGAKSGGHLDGIAPESRGAGPVLVVAGSHTLATTRQLEQLWLDHPARVELDTEALLGAGSAGSAEIRRTAEVLRTALAAYDVVTLSTSRVRRREHGSLDHGAAVMRGVTAVVGAVVDQPGVIVAKGGITSAEVARTSLDAERAYVHGQLETGVSWWTVHGSGRDVPYVVVPGNVGDRDTLSRLVRRCQPAAGEHK